MAKFKAAVMGGTGYAGAEFIRRLLMHPSVDLVRVASIDHVGEPLAAAHPNLEGQTDLVFESCTPEQAAAGVDVVLLGLPTTVSAKVVPDLMAAGVKVVDLSGAFRLNDPKRYERFYGEKHPHPELLERFVYGLPELNREAIAESQTVASPGCFATTIELGLIPLAKAGLLSGAVHTVGITGSSGSGSAPLPTTHHPVRASNLRAYRALNHQHAPEIEDTLRQAGAASDVSVQFVPVSAPLPRGILATSFVRLPSKTKTEDLFAAFEKAYAGSKFVRIPHGRLPEVIAVAGSNYAEVAFVAGPVEGDQRLVTSFSATDNLVKGGAGQVVQCMNLMLGLDEDEALTDPGSYP